MNKKLTTITLTLMAFLLGGCSGQTYQFTETTADGTYVRNVNRGAFHRHESEEFDSRIAYRNCLSDMNRRQMGPSAVEYCRQETRSDRRKRENVKVGETPNSGGMSMMGPGAMMGPGGYRQGTLLPIYSAPLGPMDYEGSTADPRTSSQAASAGEAKRQSGSSGSSADDKAVLDQIARNAEEARKAQERLDRLEAERSQNE